MGVQTVNSAILWLAILFFVLGLGLMIARGALSRNKVDTLYGVGQIKSRQVKFREMMTGLLLWVVGLVLLVMWWLLTSGILQPAEGQPIEQVVQVESTDSTLPPPIVATDTAIYTPTPTMIVLATTTGQAILELSSVPATETLPSKTELVALPTLSADALTAAFESTEATLPPPPTIAPTAVPVPTIEEVEEPKPAKINIEYVNVRTEPAVSSDILVVLAEIDDEILGVYQWTEVNEGYKWRQVETYAGTGWVVEDYLTFIEE